MTPSERAALIAKCPEVAKVFAELDAALDACRIALARIESDCETSRVKTSAGDALRFVLRPQALGLGADGGRQLPAALAGSPPKIAGGKCTPTYEEDPK